MLPSSESIRTFFLGAECVLQRLKPGTLIIDCSSIAASVSLEVAIAAASLGLDIVDAPVSGGILAA